MGVQVQTLYKGGPNGALTPFYKRAFTGFKWGSRDIEEFDLIATFQNDGMNKNLYGQFEDITKTYTEVVGQQYYKTNFKNNTLHFTLATDGITEAQLTEFAGYFTPGIERDLILAEHPYRAIGARISSPPQLKLMPFEVTRKIYHNKFDNVNKRFLNVTTTEYKGEIELEFVMDYPYWHSTVEKGYFSPSGDVSTNDGYTEDQLKAMYEDGIPHEEIMRSTNYKVIEKGITHYKDANKNVLDTFFYDTTGTKKITFNSDSSSKYIYYCGTAPAFPVIEFSLNIGLLDNNSGYIGTIGSKYHSSREYDYFYIGEDKESNRMYFTLPSLFSSYNDGINIVKQYSDNKNFEDLKKDLRDNIVNYHTRSAFMGILESGNYNNNGKIKNIAGYKAELKNLMYTGDQNGILAKITLDCKNGSANLQCAFNGTIINQSCGDMLLSRFLKINGESSFAINNDENSNIFIVHRKKIYCSLVQSFETFKIDYDYMYL